jgi:hypothetical protein
MKDEVEFMNSSKDILKKWGIYQSEDIYLPEYLMQLKPNNISYIDQCPFSVGEKHSQIELIFQEVIDGNLSESDFLDIEKKHRNIMVKLLLYNDLFVESKMFKDLDVEKIYDKIEKKYYTKIKELKNNYFDSETNFIKIDNKIELESLVQLSLREIIDTSFYFSDYQMIIVPSFSCFIVYFNDLENKHILKNIVTTEGLYLREYSE